MRLVRLALALIALLPLSAFVSVQPVFAQANCRWDLDGEWVGQRTGNRVMQEMRPGGFMVWVVGTPKPGQAEGDHMFRDTGPRAWTWTFPDKTKTFARLEANGTLKVTNPDGWTDTFKRVRPATPPKCVPLAGTGAATAKAGFVPANGSAIASSPRLAAPGRIVKRVGLEDIKAIAVAEGLTITETNDRGATVVVRATAANGDPVQIVGHSCGADGVPGCKSLSMAFHYAVPGGIPLERVNRASADYLTHVFYLDDKRTVAAIRYLPLFDGTSIGVVRGNLRMLIDIQPTIRSTLGL